MSVCDPVSTRQDYIPHLPTFLYSGYPWLNQEVELCSTSCEKRDILKKTHSLTGSIHLPCSHASNQPRTGPCRTPSAHVSASPCSTSTQLKMSPAIFLMSSARLPRIILTICFVDFPSRHRYTVLDASYHKHGIFGKYNPLAPEQDQRSHVKTEKEQFFQTISHHQ